jgi:arginase
MDVSLIQVPYMLGDPHHGAAEGPRRYLESGAADLLTARGHHVNVEVVERDGLGLIAVSKALAPVVGRSVAAGRLPIVLAGSCDASLGVLAGFEHSSCGVVWIDAHADFNTPESSVSGFFPGMSAAVIVGHCHARLWSRAGDATPVPEEHVAMLGTRELSPDAERDRLKRSRIHVVRWRDGLPQADIDAALDAVAGRVDEIYLHIDNDALDPAAAPGIVDDPVPGGLSLEQLEDVVDAVTARFRIRAATLATYTPERDEDERTLRAGLRVIELLGEPH